MPIKAPQLETLEEKQQRFMDLWSQWARLVYQFLGEKGVSVFSEEAVELFERFQGRVWAEFDKFDRSKGTFNSWRGWQFKAWWRDVARTKKQRRQGEENIQMMVGHHTGEKRIKAPNTVADGLVPGATVDDDGHIIEHTTDRPSEGPIAEMHLRRVLAGLSREDQEAEHSS
jgi:hypothetical protein